MLENTRNLQWRYTCIWKVVVPISFVQTSNNDWIAFRFVNALQYLHHLSRWLPYPLPWQREGESLFPLFSETSKGGNWCRGNVEKTEEQQPKAFWSFFQNGFKEWGLSRKTQNKTTQTKLFLVLSYECNGNWHPVRNVGPNSLRAQVFGGSSGSLTAMKNTECQSELELRQPDLRVFW